MCAYKPKKPNSSESFITGRECSCSRTLGMWQARGFSKNAAIPQLQRAARRSLFLGAIRTVSEFRGTRCWKTSHVALPLQVVKIRAIRETAKAIGVPFVLNARTDIYLLPIGEEATRFERTVERLRAYRDAGADCLFAPGVYDRETIAKLVKAVEAPINILANPACPPMAELEKIGVARVSAGSGIMRVAMGAVQRIGEEMLRARSCETMFAGAIPYAELNRMMNRRANEANA